MTVAHIPSDSVAYAREQAYGNFKVYSYPFIINDMSKYIVAMGQRAIKVPFIGAG